VITNPDGSVSFDLDAYGFVRDVPAPDTVNPSLWRQSQLLGSPACSRWSPAIYQVRNFDLAVMSFIRGETGWIVVDPLVTAAPAAEALRLVREHVADLPVTAVLSTHSHADHFGGHRRGGRPGRRRSGPGAVRGPGRLRGGVGVGERARRQRHEPAGVVHVRQRRPAGPEGAVGAGLGPSTSTGSMALYPPTDIIDHTPQELVIDGVRFVFQHTPGAEAPAEYCFYLPDHRALCMAEIASHTLHNLYTLRGAKVRDALTWSKHIHEALRLFGGQAQVLFASHHWPTWGNEALRGPAGRAAGPVPVPARPDAAAGQPRPRPGRDRRDAQLPDGISRRFGNRGYYGSVNHNVKAVYNFYLGLVRRQPGQPAPAATGGGRDEVRRVRRRHRCPARAGPRRLRGRGVPVGRRGAEPPGVRPPRRHPGEDLLADTYEQLAYQAESGPWRNFYLAGATELRHGIQPVATPEPAQPGMVASMSVGGDPRRPRRPP
jgi:alkyl sulfatase BDS1-like metallo-beta-lactamase superfamily hydrolase